MAHRTGGPTPEIPDNPRYLTVAPISHVAGTKALPSLIRGGTVHLLKGFDPGAVFKTIELERRRPRAGMIALRRSSFPTFAYAVYRFSMTRLWTARPK